MRARTLAAIALYDHVPQAPQRALDATVHQWWERQMVPALRGGKSVVARDDAYALWELLHAVRDNTNLDLRESVPQLLQGLSHRAPAQPLSGHLPRGGKRVPHRRHQEGRRARPAGGGLIARGRTGHGGAGRQRRRKPGAAGLADARSLHAARHLRGALRVPVGQPLPARPELLSRAADLSQCGFRQALRALQLGRGRGVVRLLRRRACRCSRRGTSRRSARS